MVTPSRKTSSAGSLRDELATERAKLAGVAPQATKNDSDAQLRDRGTHTGEQAMSTITGLIVELAAKATPTDIANAIAALIASSPVFLSTLDDLANALGVDPATLNGKYARLAAANAFAIRPTVVGAGAVETQNNKGVANGYPSLGADGLVLSSQLPVNGSYKGGWNASTNSPAIVAGVGTNGDEYTVTVAGTNSITGSSVSWGVGDRAKFTTTGNKWERIPSVQAINSVNGQTGIVVVTKADVGLSNVDNTSDANKPVSTAQQTALNAKANANNPVLTGTVTLPGIGTNSIYAGLVDAAGYTGNNLRFRGHFGMGMETYDGSINGYYDFRAGKWDVKGGYYVNGVVVAKSNDIFDGGTF